MITKTIKTLYRLFRGIFIDKISIFFLKNQKVPKKINIDFNNKIGITSYPYKGIAQKFSGGDKTVENQLKKLFIDNNYEVFDIVYDVNKVRFGKIYELLFGVAFVYSKIINEEGKKYGIIICGSEVSYNIIHPRCISIFHICYNEFLEQVINKTQRINRNYYKRLSFIQKQGAINTINIAVSESLSSDLKKAGIRVDYIINNAVNTNKFKRINIERNNKYLFAGAFSWYAKGFDILEKLSEYEIYCITNGSDVKSKLKFIKNVEHDEMIKYYNSYSILLFPSRYESFGLVPLEALACGMPIIMNNTGIASEIKKIESTFVVENNNIEEYKEKIQKIQRNYEFYSKKAEYIVNEFFSIEKFENDWINLLEKIKGESK